MKHTQLPLIAVLQGGADPPEIADFQSGRDAAMLEVAAAYERAFRMIDPRDHEELAWYADRLRDARLAAGLDPPAHLPRAHE